MDFMEKLDDEALDLLFREARTHNVWLDQKISDDTLRQLYAVAKWCPMSAMLGQLASFLFDRRRRRRDFGHRCLQVT